MSTRLRRASYFLQVPDLYATSILCLSCAYLARRILDGGSPTPTGLLGSSRARILNNSPPSLSSKHEQAAGKLQFGYQGELTETLVEDCLFRCRSRVLAMTCHGMERKTASSSTTSA